EASKTFLLNLFYPTNATIADGQGVGNILNDDGPQIWIIDSSATEGNSGLTPMTFTVMLTAASSLPVSVDYATTPSADAGIEYQATSGTLTFAPGETTKTVTVNVIGDTLYEGGEYFTVRLSNGNNGVVGGTAYAATGTIRNDDPMPSITVNDASVVEGNS